MVYFYSIRSFFLKRFFQLFEKYNGPKAGHLKLKHPGQLQVCLDLFLISLIKFIHLGSFGYSSNFT
jgi:hypothetical protein